MRLLSLFALFATCACVRTSAEPPSASSDPAVPAQSATTIVVSSPEMPPSASASAPASASGSSSAAVAVPAAPSADDFIACRPEQRNVRGCTRDLRPVCAQIATGVACVKAPCPQAIRYETRPNPCVACTDASTVGYVPKPCFAEP